MTERGFAAIALHSPKSDGNIGGAIRAAGVFGARLVVIGALRSGIRGRVERTDPRSTHRHLPVQWLPNVIEGVPHDCRVVGVEIVDYAVPLPAFEHPERAYYIFGSEDHGLPWDIIGCCDNIVKIPAPLQANERNCLMPEISPAIGHNTGAEVDFAKLEVERLEKDYPALVDSVGQIVADASAALGIDSPQKKEVAVDVIKRGRDVVARLDAFHDVEKQPHFRRGQGVDQFFFGMIDLVRRRSRNNRPGAIDELQSDLTAYDTRVLAEEQERRRLAAEKAAREEAARRAEADRLAREAEEARQKAERARTPQTTAAKAEAAQEVERRASDAAVEATVAGAAAESAYVKTLSRPADIMRTRTAGGTLSTMQQEPYAEIEKVADLDGARLWTFVSYAEKEKALRAFAKATNYAEPMAGAKIGRRPKSTVR